MNYVSTRDPEKKPVNSARAIATGLCPDGGLYMPEKLPTFRLNDFISLMGKTYPERAALILSSYLEDYTYDELLEDAKAAYAEEKFGPHPAPVTALSDMHVLELWHGPTCAFKDMALQLMPRLFVRALRKCEEGREALILVATSGDTGKAALEGYRDVPGTKISVFYPTDGVSRMQKLQMQTQQGSNVSVHGIRGNFDDAQTGVKMIFADQKMKTELDKKGVFFSSANSINWGRLVPQIVYYVSAYVDMVKCGSIQMGESVDVCVPTGNFGDIFAAYLAKRSGLPIGKLICASNKNRVLTDFFESGTYDRTRPFYATVSPSMDILISSNIERLLYLVAGPERTAEYMEKLRTEGKYTLCEKDFEAIRREFVGFTTGEEQTKATIKEVFASEQYLIDTHTAVAVHAAKEYLAAEGAKRKLLTVSTASAYKFASDVLDALESGASADDVLSALSEKTGTPVPAPLADLTKKPVRFGEAIASAEMPDAVRAFADQ